MNVVACAVHLDGLAEQAGVQVAGDEAGADPLDLVRARVAARDDRRLCRLHCYDLHAHTELQLGTGSCPPMSDCA